MTEPEAATIPGFQLPENPTIQDPNAPPPPPQTPYIRGSALSGLGQRIKEGLTRTGISSPTSSGDALPRELGDPVVVARAVTAVLGGVGTLVALAVSYGTGKRRHVRELDPEDHDAIVAGLTGIASRHAPALLASPDLVDIMGVAAAIGRHLKDGPLTVDLATRSTQPPTMLDDPMEEYSGE
jgi:hypothetical protein